MSLLYNTAEVKRNLGLDSVTLETTQYNPLDFDLVGQNLACMLIQAVFYFLLTLLIQYKSFMVKNCKRQKQESLEKEKKLEDTEYVRIRNLSKTYRPKMWWWWCSIKQQQQTVAVKSLTFSLARGECLGLFGKNGAGKSTTFKMIIGELPSDNNGDVVINEKSIRDQPYEVYKDLGYCPQADALFSLLTVREHLYFYGMLRGIPEHLIRSIGDRVLQRFDLDAMADRIASGSEFLDFF